MTSAGRGGGAAASGGRAPARGPRIPELPRVPLVRRPTPLSDHPRLANAVGIARLSVKREDLSGFSMGGNKPRQLEAILAEARSRGADTLIATAAAQSNFCQTAAAAAAHLGWRCILLLRGSAESEVQGNLLLDRLFGAEIRFLDTRDPYDRTIPERLAAAADEVREGGGRPYVVHLPGQTGALSAAGAADLAGELGRQFGTARQEPDEVVLAVGSGLTACGLVLGLKRLGVGARVVGISVQQKAEFLKPLMIRRANEAATILGIGTRVEARDFELDDRFVGPGYGIPSRESVDAVSVAARCAALLLDPAYSGKALAGLIGRIREGSTRRTAHAAFLHTGGAASLFAHARTLAGAIPFPNPQR